MLKKRIFGFLTAAVLCGTALLSFPQMTAAPLKAEAADGRLYNQWDPKWLEYTWNGYATTGNSLYTSACGIFSFCNAIYALNGIQPDAVEVAQWAYDIKAFRPGGGGTYRDLLYANIEQKFGEKFHFTLGKEYFGTVTQPAAINHLKTGGVIVLHVPGHFIAVTGYNEQDKTYHVIESAVSDSRGLAPDSWVSGEKLSTGKTAGQWFILISNTEAPSRASVSLASGIDYAGANELIDFVLDSDTRNTFALGINDMDRFRIKTIFVRDYALSSRQHIRTELPPGDYTCYATGGNGFGMLDSPNFEFHVYEGAPEYADAAVASEKGEVGKPISMMLFGKISTEQTITIQRGEEPTDQIHAVRVLNNNSVTEEWTPSRPGKYTISFEIANSYGALYPDPVTVTVAGDVPVSFDAAGGSMDDAPRTFTYSEPYGDLPEPHRDWWRFEGWYTEPAGGEKIAADTTVTNPDAHTLYAHWSKIYQKGDVNVDDAIDSTDAQIVLKQYLAALSGKQADSLDPTAAALADIDGSGALSLEDAQLILMYYVRNTVAKHPTGWEELLANRTPETTVTTTETTTTATETTTTGTTASTSKTTTAKVTTTKPVTTKTVTTTAKSVTTKPVTTTAKSVTTKSVTTTAKPVTTKPVTTTAKPVTTKPVTTTAKPVTTKPVTSTANPVTTSTTGTTVLTTVV